MEIQIRFALHLFFDETKEVIVKRDNEEQKEPSNEITQAQALFLYVETRLKPFVADF